jgi:hypothetical protein
MDYCTHFQLRSQACCWNELLNRGQIVAKFYVFLKES